MEKEVNYWSGEDPWSDTYWAVDGQPGYYMDTRGLGGYFYELAGNGKLYRTRRSGWGGRNESKERKALYPEQMEEAFELDPRFKGWYDYHKKRLDEINKETNGGGWVILKNGGLLNYMQYCGL